MLGARQVGKTYSLLDFGKQHYKHVAYINCDNNEQAKNLFVQDYNIERILFAIAAITGVPVVPGASDACSDVAGILFGRGNAGSCKDLFEIK